MNKDQRNTLWIETAPAVVLGLALTATMAAQTAPAPAAKTEGAVDDDKSANGNRSIWTVGQQREPADPA